MPYSYIFHPDAQDEYQSSVLWYLEKTLSAGSHFVLEVDKALVKILADPKRYPNNYGHYFEYHLRKYPFTLVYTIDDDLSLVVIIAIYHQKRKPENKFR